MTQSCSSSPFSVQRLSASLAPNFKIAANFSVQEVLQMVVRDKKMCVDVYEVANKEVTLADRVPKGGWKC